MHGCMAIAGDFAVSVAVAVDPRVHADQYQPRRHVRGCSNRRRRYGSRCCGVEAMPLRAVELGRSIVDAHLCAVLVDRRVERTGVSGTEVGSGDDAQWHAAASKLGQPTFQQPQAMPAFSEGTEQIDVVGACEFSVQFRGKRGFVASVRQQRGIREWRGGPQYRRVVERGGARDFPEPSQHAGFEWVQCFSRGVGKQFEDASRQRCATLSGTAARSDRSMIGAR